LEGAHERSRHLAQKADSAILDDGNECSNVTTRDVRYTCAP
jgi:hypothetical protein